MNEDGGWPEADVLQTADSLSFLAWRRWSAAGSNRAAPERGAAKVRSSIERIKPDMTRARELAEPMLRDTAPFE